MELVPLPRRLADFNRTGTNRVTRHFVTWLPGFGLLRHPGRRSGRIYETPVNVFRIEGGFAFALTYGRGDWVRNVIDAGSAELVTRRRTHTITNPTIVESPDHHDLPRIVRWVLKLIDVDEELHANAM